MHTPTQLKGLYGATVGRLPPDQKAGSSNLSALIFLMISMPKMRFCIAMQEAPQQIAKLYLDSSGGPRAIKLMIRDPGVSATSVVVLEIGVTAAASARLVDHSAASKPIDEVGRGAQQRIHGLGRTRMQMALPNLMPARNNNPWNLVAFLSNASGHGNEFTECA